MRTAGADSCFPESDGTRLCERTAGGGSSAAPSTAESDDLQRGWQARPGPYARWCLTFVNWRQHFWQSCLPAASRRALNSSELSRAPTQQHAQCTGASMSTGFSLDKAGHHPNICN